MKQLILFALAFDLFVASGLGAEKAEDLTFEIYATQTNHQVQIFLKVTNHSETPYNMEQPHGGGNYYRYYKSRTNGKYGDYLDVIVPGTRMKGPMITVTKGKPYHYKLYDLPDNLHVIMKVKYILDSGKEVYTNEIEI